MKRLLVLFTILCALAMPLAANADYFFGGSTGGGGTPGGSPGDVQCNFGGSFGGCSHLIDQTLLPVPTTPASGQFYQYGTAWDKSAYKLPTTICDNGKVLISNGTDLICSTALGSAAYANTGAFAPASGIALSALANQAADTILVNNTASPAAPIALAMTAQTVFGMLTGEHPKPLSVAELQTLIGLGASGQHADNYFQIAGNYQPLASLTGSSLTVGKVYYRGASALTLAEADSASTLPAICLAVSATSCVFSGVYTYGATQGWTAGNILYVSASSAGALVTTAPSTVGQFVQRVGVALAADTILIMPSLDVGGL